MSQLSDIVNSIEYYKRTRNPKRMLRIDDNTYNGGNLGTITFTKKRKKPYFLSSRTGQLTAGDALKGVDAAIGPLMHWAQPSQYVGVFRDAVKGKNPLTSMLRGNSGIVSKEYAAEHPWISTALNFGVDMAIPTTMWVKNTTPVKNYRLSRVINKAVKENPVITGYNRNPTFMDIGNLSDYQAYLEQVYPNTKIKDILWHGSKVNNLQEFDTKAIGSNMPIKGSVGMYLAPEKYTAQGYGNTIYPVLLNSENPYITDQLFNSAVKGVNSAKISPKVKNTLLANNDAVVAPRRGEVVFFDKDNALILGSKKDLLGFKTYMNKPKGLLSKGPLVARGVPEITAENAASIAPAQWDAAYMNAINVGDIAEAQRLRDLHANIKGYNSNIPLYHGSPKTDITSFNPDAQASTWEGSGGTVFLTPSRIAAEDYAKQKGILQMTHNTGRVYKLYSAHKNPKIVDYNGASYTGIGYEGELDDFFIGKTPLTNNGLKYFEGEVPFPFSYEPQKRHLVITKDGEEITARLNDITFLPIKVAGRTSEEAAKAISEGYDAAILKNVNEGIGPQGARIGPIDDIAIRDTKLIKSADAITYDNAGNIIPLSKRDNFNINDIRYGLTPWAIGFGTLGTLLNKKQ